MMELLKRMAIVSSLALAVPAPAIAQDSEPSTEENQVTVEGVGEAYARSDTVDIVLRFSTQARTAREALSRIEGNLRRVAETAAQLGIAEDDVRVADLRVTPNLETAPRPRYAGADAGGAVAVRVRNMARLGEIVDQLAALLPAEIRLGTPLRGDASEARDRARRLGAADATARGRALAEATGISLGRVVTVSERFESAALDSQVDVAPEGGERPEVIMRAFISITWEIAR